MSGVEPLPASLGAELYAAVEAAEAEERAAREAQALGEAWAAAEEENR